MFADSQNKDMPDLINFITTNGYELEDVKYNPRFGATATAIFSKMTHIVDIEGNDINDAQINISIEFDTRFDYKNGVLDEEEGIVYDFDVVKAKTFIKKLIAGNYRDATAKGKVKRTRKNRKHLVNRRK